MMKKSEIHDELISSVYNVINSSESPFSAYFLDNPEWNPSDITDWVSIGDPIMDMVISNRRNGGIPVGRITEINGLESCVSEDTIIDIIIE